MINYRKVKIGRNVLLGTSIANVCMFKKPYFAFQKIYSMRQFFILLLSIFTIAQVDAQGIDFFHGTWNEALDESKNTGKPIFVDAYAKWCGPCKRMARTTFMDKQAGEFFNKNFINVKMDAEEGEGVKFRRKYPVSAFPTLFFIDEKGEVLHKAVGGQNVQGLISLGNIALEKIDYSHDYQVKYEEGERDPQFIFEYVKSLNKSNKASLKVSNEYLRTQEDLTTEFNLRFILEAATEADSRIFNLLIEHQTAIGKLEGLEAVQDRILLACDNTAKKAVEFQYEELLQEAKDKMRKHLPAKADAFAAEADMKFFRSTGDAEKYGKACADFAKHVAHGNAKELDGLAKDMLSNFAEHEKCMKMAEKYAKQAASSGKEYGYYLTYASILKNNGKTKQAKGAAEKALALAKEKGGPAEMEVRRFLQRLES